MTGRQEDAATMTLFARAHGLFHAVARVKERASWFVVVGTLLRLPVKEEEAAGVFILSVCNVCFSRADDRIWNVRVCVWRRVRLAQLAVTTK